MTAGGGQGVSVVFADDDLAARKAIAAFLAEAGHEVRAASSGAAALALYRERRPDVMLLDVMMPGMSGYDVCREVRRDDALTPVVFLTALDGEAAELEGLGLGADDYVSKSAPPATLLARVAAAARRSPRREGAADFAFGSHMVEAAALRAVPPDGAPVALTEREVAMLRLFAAHPGEVFNRDFLFARFWGPDFAGVDAALTMAVSRLRAKLGADGARIRSVCRVGYAYGPQGGASR